MLSVGSYILTYNKTKMNKTEIKKAFLNIVDSIDLCTKLENCYGEIRFRVADGQLVEPNMIMKIYGTLFAILVLIAYLFFMCFFCFDIKLFGFNFNIDNATYDKKLLLAMLILQYIIGLVKFLHNDRENIKIIISLAHIDCSLKVLDNRVFYKKIQKYNKIVILVFIIMLINGVAIDSIENSSCVLSLLIYSMIEVFANNKFDLKALVFYLYIKMLSDRLDILNKCLEKFVLNKDKSRCLIIYQDFNTSERQCYIGDITKIPPLAAIYENIGETLSLINNLFNINIFMYLATVFIYIIVTLGSSVDFIRSEKKFTLLIGFIFQCVEAMSVVIVICYVCEALSLKRQSTKNLINEIIMDYKIPKEMRIQAKAFMDLTDEWPLKVYACNMFCFNIQLLINFIELSASYLILIVQATK